MWKEIDFEEKYFEGMVQLIKDNYGDVEIAHKDFLRWQYFENPAGKALIKLAYDEENRQIVGLYVLAPFDIKVGNRTMKCCNDIDTITRMEYRKQGIFLQLAKGMYKKCAKEQYEFIIQFPNKNSIQGYRKYFNPPVVLELPLIIRPIDLATIVSKKSNEFLGSLFNFANTLLKVKVKQTEEGYRIDELNYENVLLFDEFWAANRTTYNIAIERSTDYIRWRYLDVPLRKYKTLVLLKDGKIKGYVVCTYKQIMGLDAGVIVDYVVCNEVSESQARKLIQCALYHLEEANLDIAIAFHSPKSREYELLVKEKFIKCPQKILPREFKIFCQHTLGNDEYFKEYICNGSNWFTTIGDHLLV